jgi:hypothetical protein
MFRTFVGEAVLRAGDPAGAIEVLRQAEEVDTVSGERWFLPETLRLRAAAEAAGGADADDVAALLARAFELAGAQGSVLFAARAEAQLAG